MVSADFSSARCRKKRYCFGFTKGFFIAVYKRDISFSLRLCVIGNIEILKLFIKIALFKSIYNIFCFFHFNSHYSTFKKSLTVFSISSFATTVLKIGVRSFSSASESGILRADLLARISSSSNSTFPATAL